MLCPPKSSVSYTRVIECQRVFEFHTPPRVVIWGLIKKKNARLFLHKMSYTDNPALASQKQPEPNHISLSLLISHAFSPKLHLFLFLVFLSLSLSPMAKLFAFGALWLCLVVTAICPRHCVSVRSDQEIRDRFYGNLLNGTAPDSGDGSIAKMFDRVLEKEFSEKEFSENDQPEGKAFVSLFFIASCWFVVVLDAIFFWKLLY